MDAKQIRSWLWKTARTIIAVEAKTDGNRRSLVVCKNCSREFVSTRKKKFCNSKCYDAWYKRSRRKRTGTLKPKHCTECGKLFRPKRINVKRCSGACRSTYNRKYFFERNRKFALERERKREDVYCKHCGELFVQKSYKHLFCTKECKRIWSSIQIKRANKNFIDKIFLRPVKDSDITRTDLAEEIQKYKEAGGKITVLPTLPGPEQPDVNVTEQFEEITDWKDTWSDRIYEDAEKMEDEE